MLNYLKNLWTVLSGIFMLSLILVVPWAVFYYIFAFWYQWHYLYSLWIFIWFIALLVLLFWNYSDD